MPLWLMNQRWAEKGYKSGGLIELKWHTSTMIDYWTSDILQTPAHVSVILGRD